jgi:hypothetical protein
MKALALFLLFCFTRFNSASKPSETFGEELHFTQLTENEIMSNFQFTIKRNISSDDRECMRQI